MDPLRSRAKIKLAGTCLLILTCASIPSARAQNQVQRPRNAVTVLLGDSPYLGIQMEDVTSNDVAKHILSGERGVIVKQVEKGSPAETAKIQEKDVILEFSGMPVLSAAQLSRMVHETPVGRKVDIVVSRDGRKLNLTAQIGEREGQPGLGRNYDMLPGDGRGFEFFGPEGRAFRFRVPGGNQFFYQMPGMGGRVLEGQRLGLNVEPLSDQMAEFLGVKERRGVLVTSVAKDSPAASKLKAGDVVVQADGQNVYSPDDLARIVQRKEGGSIDLKIVRDKRDLTVTVDLPNTGSPKERRGFRL